MNKLTCIQCPQGCLLTVRVENGRFSNVTGHKCPKGEAYARQETENPVRVITSTVTTRDLDLNMLPVKTSSAVPKKKIKDILQEIHKIRQSTPVKCGDTIAKNLCGLGADLIATREAKLKF